MSRTVVLNCPECGGESRNISAEKNSDGTTTVATACVNQRCLLTAVWVYELGHLIKPPRMASGREAILDVRLTGWRGVGPRVTCACGGACKIIKTDWLTEQRTVGTIYVLCKEPGCGCRLTLAVSNVRTVCHGRESIREQISRIHQSCQPDLFRELIMTVSPDVFALKEKPPKEPAAPKKNNRRGS